MQLSRVHRGLELAASLDSVVDGSTKGMPGYLQPVRLGDIATMGWNVADEDLPLPLMVLRRSAVEANIATMARYCRQHDVDLAPHGKTTMAPQLFDRQLAAGAWGMTAATVQQLHVYRAFGVQRVLLANEVVGRPNADYVVRELARDPSFKLVTLVDSPESVDVLVRAAADHPTSRPLRVIVEIGYPGGRSGVRDETALAKVTEAVRASRGTVELAGVGGYEGLIATRHAGAGPTGSTVEGYLTWLGTAVERLDGDGMLPADAIVTAGGSAAFDTVVDVLKPLVPARGRLLLRSGCYLTHDHGMYARSSPLHEPNAVGMLVPALEVWTYVLSTPEPGLSLLTAGRRDVPYDSGLPIPLALRPAGSDEVLPLTGEVVQLSDQHAYLRSPQALRVGDRVVLGISHPCAAFDRWAVVPEVDDDDNVIGAVRTYF